MVIASLLESYYLVLRFLLQNLSSGAVDRGSVRLRLPEVERELSFDLLSLENMGPFPWRPRAGVKSKPELKFL